MERNRKEEDKSYARDWERVSLSSHLPLNRVNVLCVKGRQPLFLGASLFDGGRCTPCPETALTWLERRGNRRERRVKVRVKGLNHRQERGSCDPHSKKTRRRNRGH